MSPLIRAFLAAGLMVWLPLAQADDGNAKDKSKNKSAAAKTRTGPGKRQSLPEQRGSFDSGN